MMMMMIDDAALACVGMPNHAQDELVHAFAPQLKRCCG
jgi:hypothetical protein